MNKSRNVRYYLAGSIAIITFLAYLPALRNEFLNWDDDVYVVDNLHIRSFDLTMIKWAFFHFHAANWHPLTWISHSLDYALWGLNPLGHHLTNIILHSLNAFAAVLLILKLLEAWNERTGDKNLFPGTGSRLISAGAAGLLFGLHPIHVESVAWVAERKDLLCGLFFLLSIMMYTGRARGRASTPRAMRHAAFADKYYLAAFGFFILALLSKPMAVTLPLALLIIDWHPLGRITSVKMFRSAFLEKIPFFAFSLASSIITIAAQKTGGATVSFEFTPLWVRLLVAARSLIAYLWNLALPFHLVPYHPFPNDRSLVWFFPVLLVIGISLAAFVYAKKSKLLISVWAYFVLTLIPVLGIVQVGSQAMADRYLYLPSLGLFLATGLGAAWIAERAVRPGRNRFSAILVTGAAAAGLCISLCYLTIKQTAVWQNSLVFWNYTVNNVPESWLAFYNRGLAYAAAGRLDKAIEDYDKSIALKPTYQAFFGRGAAFEKTERLDRAISDFSQAITFEPSSSEAYNNRGMVYQRIGRLSEAIDDFRTSIALSPYSHQAYENMGILYLNAGSFDLAVEYFNKSLELNPGATQYANRGIALALTGRRESALADFNKALELDPRLAPAYFNRANLLMTAGERASALGDFQSACSLGYEPGCDALAAAQKTFSRGR